MIEFKKRLRILADEQNYRSDYLSDGGMRFSKDDAVLQFNPKSQRFVACAVIDKNQSFSFDFQKEFVFDVFLRFCNPGSRMSLKNYAPGPLLTLEDYINEEDGRQRIDKLRSKLKAGPIALETLGGNRILVEYRSGVLVIADDLMIASTNVIEFS